jgi:hypothetical protein
MTMLYPIVFETEQNGAVSACVPGLPVYAAADSQAKAERAIRAVLAEYLGEHPDARVRVARVSDRGKARISVVGVWRGSARGREEQRRQGTWPLGPTAVSAGAPLSATKRVSRAKASR